jgi:WD40 repeat protein
MSQSRKRAHESADSSGEMEGVASDTQPAPSDQRVFSDVLEMDSDDEIQGFLLTTERAYVADQDTIVVYDTATRQKINEIEPEWGYIHDISLSMDGKSLFVACCLSIASIINLVTGKAVILRGHADCVKCIIQGEGTDVLTCSNDRTIRRWNSLTGECLKIYKGHTDWVFSILYDEATKRIFSASYDETFIVWNGNTGEKIGVMKGHGDWVGSLARVNDTTIASGSGDGTIKLWDVTTLTCIKTLSNGEPVSSVVATPDGLYLISGSYDNNVKVWSVATGKCLHTLSHHREWVVKVAVSPDGRFIASSAGDHMFHLFSVSPSFSIAANGAL